MCSVPTFSIEPPERVGEFKTLFLTQDEKSWIKYGHVDRENGGLTMQEFEELWTEKPQEKATITIYGKTITCPRYTKNYLQKYRFSGTVHQANDELPPLVKKLFEYSKNLSPSLNQCLVNFYDSDGSIGKHCDDERQIIKDSDIHSWSFGPAIRFFILEAKDKSNRFKIKVDHNTLLIMGGRCQTTHFHQVPKIKDKLGTDGRRINVTFRSFNR